MAEKLGIYKCEICGNIVEAVHEGKGKMMCCGKEMQLYRENTVDASQEKHVPVIEKVPGGILVKVGSTPHPMEPDHYIEWIEVLSGDKAYREFLKPGNPPEVFFPLDEPGMTVREYCNIHRLWKGEAQ